MQPSSNSRFTTLFRSSSRLLTAGASVILLTPSPPYRARSCAGLRICRDHTGPDGGALNAPGYLLISSAASSLSLSAQRMPFPWYRQWAQSFREQASSAWATTSVWGASRYFSYHSMISPPIFPPGPVTRCPGPLHLPPPCGRILSVGRG